MTASLVSASWLDAATAGAQAASRALGGEHAQLAYVNDFENNELTVRGAPIGRGAAASDVEVAGTFHYRVARHRYPDARAGVRFVTADEQPGGWDYSIQTPVAMVRGGLLLKPIVVYAWSVHLPELCDFTEASSYWENRTVWVTMIQGVRELAKLRFLDNRSLCWEIGGVLGGAKPVRVGSRVDLERPVESGSRIDLVVALRRKARRAIVLLDGQLDGEIVELGDTIDGATLDMMSSAGNSLRHDRDLRYFTGLSSLAIFTAGVEWK